MHSTPDQNTGDILLSAPGRTTVGTYAADDDVALDSAVKQALRRYRLTDGRGASVVGDLCREISTQLNTAQYGTGQTPGDKAVWTASFAIRMEHRVGQELNTAPLMSTMPDTTHIGAIRATSERTWRDFARA